MKEIVKKILKSFGINQKKDVPRQIARWSLLQAQKQQNLSQIVGKLRQIVPDISLQQSRTIKNFDSYAELKRRNLHGFQCQLMLEAIKNIKQEHFSVIDVGDSAGTHMLYLKELSKGTLTLDTLSVNLDQRATEKIRARGLKALCKRAENIQANDLDVETIGLITSFEMMEHLHNPSIFLRRMAVKGICPLILITVPFLRNSRVGLHHIRNRSQKKIHAEEEHIFELSPEDWALLSRHSGWKVIHEAIYWQYPRGIPFLTRSLRKYWQNFDYEGFWGAILKRDLKYSEQYLDWDS